MECFVLYTDGLKKNLAKAPKLKEAQKLVGGWVEQLVIRQLPPLLMLVNEEAKVRAPHPPINQAASQLYGAQILGDVVVMDREAAAVSGWLG